MKSQTLNEQLSRIKSVMGILNESTPEEDIVYSFCRAAEGPGTTIPAMIGAIAKIKDATQFWNVNAGIKKRMKTLDFAGVINDEMESDDLGTIKQITDMLSKIGIKASYQTNNSTTTSTTGQKIAQPTGFKVNTFKIDTPGGTSVTPVTQLATSGWWDKYPGLAAYMKEMGGKVHYPPAASAQTGAIAIEKEGGSIHDFFPDGRWYQYATVEEGLKAVVKAQYEGKWADRNGVLIINSNDGETWTSKTKKWAKRMQWKPETGSFPLMYGQYGPTIQTLQKSLGLKGDKYFGATTEKYILTKAAEYKRETGVTQDIYNKIVTTQPAQSTTTTTPPTEAELQANPSTLNPY